MNPYCFSGIVPLSVRAHSRRTRPMKDAREKDASLLPGNMTERTLMELCAAKRDVEVMYSLRCMGASVICSATVRAVETAVPKIGRATGPPPKSARSTTAAVAPTAVDANVLATEN